MKGIRKIGAVIFSNKQLAAGCAGMAILALIVVSAPLITRYPADIYGPLRLAAPGSAEHWLGTNHLGQDVWSMIVYGTRTSLFVAVSAAFISGILGIILGGIAGFVGGKVDTVLSELINVFIMIPDLFLIMLIIAMFGNNLMNVVVVIGITTWPRNAKLMRAQALSLRERTFVLAARAKGENMVQILFTYIIPNGIFPVISNTTMNMAYAIITEAVLAFLGLGDPTVTSWGRMIADGRSYMTTSPWVMLFAGAAIVFTVLTLNLAGDGLNYVMDPRHARLASREAVEIPQWQ
jgi:peptide/nickel transport system permease protein